MPDAFTTLRHSELLHRLVLDSVTTEEFGKVEVVWMHPEAHRVMGFVSKTSLLTKKRFAFKLSQLQSLGAEGIVVDSLPVETDAEYVGVLETLIGHELWSDGGNRLGYITDCLFDLETGEITHYLFRSQGWHGFIESVYKLPTWGIAQIGKKRVLVAQRAIPQIVIYEEGLEQKMIQAAEDLQSLTETAQTTTTRLGRQVRAITQQTTQKAKSIREEFPPQEAIKTGRSLFEQIQERVQSVGKELKEELTPLAQHIQNSTGPTPKSSRSRTRQDWEPPSGAVPQEDLEDDEPWI